MFHNQCYFMQTAQTECFSRTLKITVDLNVLCNLLQKQKMYFGIIALVIIFKNILVISNESVDYLNTIKD